MAEAAKPKWDPGQDYRAGLKAYGLAQEFKEQIEPRLPSGLLDGLKEDLDTINRMGDQRKAKVVELKGFTGTEKEICAQAGAWASAIREALKRAKVPADVKKAAGVGSKFHAARVEAIVASVNAIIAAYDKFPEAFRGAGVLPDDMEKGKRLLVSLSSADFVQETAKVSNTKTTTGRNALRKRVEDAVDRIRGAGMLHYHDQTATAARFAALVPNQGNGGGKEKPAPAAGVKN